MLGDIIMNLFTNATEKNGNKVNNFFSKEQHNKIYLYQCYFRDYLLKQNIKDTI